MKIILPLIFLISLVGCNNDEPQQAVDLQPSSKKTAQVDYFAEEKNSQSAVDDFSDLEKKEKDESCDSEEEITKKLNSQKAFQLQGGDAGCEVE